MYRNGYGKPRQLTMTGGTITLRRPRIRGNEEGFESQVLPLFKRRTEEVGALLPQLYLHGLALGDFELAFRGLLGEGAALSPATRSLPSFTRFGPKKICLPRRLYQGWR